MIDRVLLYQSTVVIALWCVWELASIPIAETQEGGRVRPPLSLYQALVYNRQEVQ